MVKRFAVFQNYIVTANKDGSIPLNSKVVCAIDDSDERSLLGELIEQANLYAEEHE